VPGIWAKFMTQAPPAAAASFHRPVRSIGGGEGGGGSGAAVSGGASVLLPAHPARAAMASKTAATTTAGFATDPLCRLLVIKPDMSGAKDPICLGNLSRRRARSKPKLVGGKSRLMPHLRQYS
jgi:hypothetical protein